MIRGLSFDKEKKSVLFIFIGIYIHRLGEDSKTTIEHQDKCYDEIAQSAGAYRGGQRVRWTRT